MSNSTITYETVIAGSIEADGSLNGSIVTDGVLKGVMSVPSVVQSGADAFVITITGDPTNPLSDKTYIQVKYAVKNNLFIIVNIFGAPYSVSGREVSEDGTVKLEILSGSISDDMLMVCYNLLYSQSGSIAIKTIDYDFSKMNSGMVLDGIDDDGNVVIMLNEKLFS